MGDYLAQALREVECIAGPVGIDQDSRNIRAKSGWIVGRDDHGFKPGSQGRTCAISSRRNAGPREHAFGRTVAGGAVEDHEGWAFEHTTRLSHSGGRDDRPSPPTSLPTRASRERGAYASHYERSVNSQETPCAPCLRGEPHRGWKISTGLPAGSSQRTWLPPGPVMMLLRNGTFAARRRETMASMSRTSMTRRFQPPAVGWRPSGIGLAADERGPLSQRSRSP